MRTPLLVLTLSLASRAALAGPITRLLCDDSVHVLTAGDPDSTGRYALAAPWTRADWHRWFPVRVWFGGHGSHAALEPGARYLVVVRARGNALGEPARCSSPDAATVVARVSLAPIDRVLDLAVPR